MSRDDIRAHYDQYGERDWERLARPANGVVERAINQHAIMRHLPPSARVLDLGGGPERTRHGA